MIAMTENDEIAKLNGFQHNNFGNFFCIMSDFSKELLYNTYNSIIK